MSSGNNETRVTSSINMVTGPLVGENLLAMFKQEILKEPVFQVMFGNSGERVFVNEAPNINETILPALLLSWKRESFMSNVTYLDGTIDALVALPNQIEGDYNSKRRVANMLQRWMGGQMSLFDKVPGLTHFGHGTEFNYEGLAKFDGFSAPVITLSIPFRFDLSLLMQIVDGFDPMAPLDDSDVGFVERYILRVFDNDTGNTLIEEGVVVETGQEN